MQPRLRSCNPLLEPVTLLASYETTDPTVDSQVGKIQAAGCDVFLNIAIAEFAAQAIRKAPELGWKPLHILNGVNASVGQTLKPAGLANAIGIISDTSFKDPSDPQWQSDAGYKWWSAFMDKYLPSGDRTDLANVLGPSIAATTVQILKQCDDDLTRENVMRQAANLHHFELPMLLPGITINTSPTDFAPIKQVQKKCFNGERFVQFGPILGSTVG